MHTYMWLVIDARDYACDSQTNWTGVLLTWHSDQYPVWGTTVSLCESTEIGKPDQLLTKRYQVQFRFREGTSSTVAFVKAVRQHRDKYAERETETETERRPKQWDNRGNGDKVCLPLAGEMLSQHCWHTRLICVSLNVTIFMCFIIQTFVKLLGSPHFTPGTAGTGWGTKHWATQN